MLLPDMGISCVLRQIASDQELFFTLFPAGNGSSGGKRLIFRRLSLFKSVLIQVYIRNFFPFTVTVLLVNKKDLQLVLQNVVGFFTSYLFTCLGYLFAVDLVILWSRFPR